MHVCLIELCSPQRKSLNFSEADLTEKDPEMNYNFMMNFDTLSQGKRQVRVALERIEPASLMLHFLVEDISCQVIPSEAGGNKWKIPSARL